MDGSGGRLEVPGTSPGMTGRRIAAMSGADLGRPDLTPGAVAPWRPRFLEVSPFALLVDEAYQRSLSPKSAALIARIVAGWDWAKFKPPIVAQTAAGYEVIDGQHTAIAAASHPAIEAIPVMLVEAAARADRAAAFVGHNRDRLALSPGELHFAAVAAGEPRALAIQAAADAAGIVLLRGPPGREIRTNETLAHATLARLFSRLDGDGLAAVLACVAAARLAPVRSWHLKAARQLLHAPEYAGHIAPEAITRALAEREADIERKAAILAASHRLDLASAAAVIIFREGQHGRRRAA